MLVHILCISLGWEGNNYLKSRTGIYKELIIIRNLKTGKNSSKNVTLLLLYYSHQIGSHTILVYQDRQTFLFLIFLSVAVLSFISFIFKNSESNIQSLLKPLFIFLDSDPSFKKEHKHQLCIISNVSKQSLSNAKP